MRNDHSPAERAQIAMGVGFSGVAAVRLLLRVTDDPTWVLPAMALGLFALVTFCYGVGQFAVSRGHSPAWGFAGFFGYLAVRFVMQPKTPATSPFAPRRMPPPPPPPGYVPTR